MRFPIKSSGQQSCAFSLLTLCAPEIHGEPWIINMIHDEDKCIVKWTAHNTQLFHGRALPEIYFYSFEKVWNAIYFLYSKTLILENNSLLLPLSSSHLQKSLGQSEVVNLWQPGVDIWGDLASFLIFLDGALARSLELFLCSQTCLRRHRALRTLLAAVVSEVILEVYYLRWLTFSC